MKKRRIITYICIFLIFFVIGRAVSNKEEVQDDIVEENTNDYVFIDDGSKITIGLVGLDTFNPVLTKNSDVVKVLDLIYDSLFEYDSNMQLKNGLVEEYSKDENILRLKLKEGIYWHNGNKLTTKDIEFTINAIKEYGGIYSSFVENIDSVSIVNDYVIELNLKDKNAMTEYDLIFPIISYTYYAGEDFKETTKNMKPIGTGIYKYLGVNDNVYTFIYNNESGRKSNIYTIEMIAYDKSGLAFAALKNKNIDIMFTSLTDYESVIGTIGYSKEEYISGNFLCIAINKEKEYLNMAKVRQAINLAIDKKGIFDKIYNGVGYVSQNIIYPNSYLYKNIDTIYDQDKAKQYLIDAKANNVLKLSLLVNKSDNKNILIANEIKEQLQRVNIQVNVVEKSHSEYLEALKTNAYDIALVCFNISNNISLKEFKEGNFYNIFYLDNENLRENIYRIAETKTNDERKVIYSKIQDVIYSEVPYIGIGFTEDTVLYNSNILGITDIQYNNIFSNISEISKK